MPKSRVSTLALLSRPPVCSLRWILLLRLVSLRGAPPFRGPTQSRASAVKTNHWWSYLTIVACVRQQSKARARNPLLQPGVDMKVSEFGGCRVPLLPTHISSKHGRGLLSRRQPRRTRSMNQCSKYTTWGRKIWTCTALPMGRDYGYYGW